MTFSEVRERWRIARQKRWVRWGTDVALFAAVLIAVTAWQTRGLVGSGEAAPPFTLTDLDGRQWSLEGLRGKKVVLTFWAPWCSVCAAETSTISSLHQSVGDDAHVVSVALSWDDVADVRRFVADHGVEYPVLLGNESVRRAFRISAFPTTYVLSKDGRIEDAAVGYTTGLGLRWRLWF